MNIILLKSIAAGMLFINASGASPMATLASAVYASPASEVAQTKLDSLDNWLNKLASKESEGKAHLKILDSNSHYSYGCLQFQMVTFKSYVHKYNLLPEAEDKELENMIYDCDFQKTLARAMIEDDYTNWRNWYTSATKKIGLPPKPVSSELALVDQGTIN